jgi:hypothetical protein
MAGIPQKVIPGKDLGVQIVACRVVTQIEVPFWLGLKPCHCTCACSHPVNLHAPTGTMMLHQGTSQMSWQLLRSLLIQSPPQVGPGCCNDSNSQSMATAALLASPVLGIPVGTWHVVTL